jgi:hypothetical protein
VKRTSACWASPRSSAAHTLAPAGGRGQRAAPGLGPLLARHARPWRARRAFEQALQRVAEPRARERLEVVGLEAEVLGPHRRQAARALAQPPLVLAEQVDEQLAPSRRGEGQAGHALVAADHHVVDVVDDARAIGERRAHERELVDGRARPARGVRLRAQRDERRRLALGAYGEVVASRRDVVRHVHHVPGEGLRHEEPLRDAVRVVNQAAVARPEPEGDAVLLHLEEARPGERHVQLLSGIRGQEGEVEVEPSGALHGK